MLHTEALTDKAKQFPGLNYQAIEGTVLATIINRKVLDVKDCVTEGVRTAPERSLFDALEKKEKRNFILECKQSSPTLGDFCKDFDLDKLIACYEKHACAISVLCEKNFFKGSIDYLRYVKEHCSLPVICKDFIICKEQIKEAYVAGADAVLLMLSVLDKDTYLELYNYAHSLNLDVLTEVDDETQAQFTIDNNIKIVGINNRDLRILKINLDTAKRISKMFPSDVRVVSESGINTHNDLTYLNPLRNFLIGSSLTSDKDVVFKANSMLYGLNKVCGLTTRQAVEAVAKNHASIGGLIFVPGTPRYVDEAKAKSFVDEFKDELKFAGVFVNADVDTMVNTARKVGLSYLQLHGTESIDTIRAIRAKLPEIKIIKAFNISTVEDFIKVKDYEEHCDLMILDSSNPGSGKSFDWGTIPADLNKQKILLSGGIGLDNVEKALSYGFAGLDMNSKLEKEKGIKDVELIDRIFKIVNNY